MTEIDQAYWDQRVPIRSRTAHKGQFGRLLILAGATGTMGAAWFSGAAAVRAGAGLIQIGLPEPVWNGVASGLYECMCTPLPADRDGRIGRDAFVWVQSRLDWCDVCLCGPGLGQSQDLQSLVLLLLQSGKPLVLDADGLNNMPKNGFPHENLILTPHQGEFIRMGGDGSAGREEAGAAYIRQNPCVLVLKGSDTLVFAPGQAPCVYRGNNPGLAKGGSGDVLAGIIAGLAAQGLPLFDAAAVGVAVHGQAGRICAQTIGEYGMTPTDLIHAIPKVLCRFNVSLFAKNEGEIGINSQDN